MNDLNDDLEFSELFVSYGIERHYNLVLSLHTGGEEEGLMVTVLTVDSGGSTAVAVPVPRWSHRCLATQGVDTSL